MPKKYITINIVLALYNVGIYLYVVVIRLTAFLGNKKARLWIYGRKEQFQRLIEAVSNAGQKRIWFHCASLGEFEQGRPLIEKIKSDDPSVFIILSFYSPSGYEIRKNYHVSDYVCYLPEDTCTNAKKFLDIVRPTKVIFIKYEFWYHFFNEIFKRSIPLYVVSAIFRPQQIFFKWYGVFYRSILSKVTHFFLQDGKSAALLKNIGLTNTTIAGDTRFDRVNEIAKQKTAITVVEKFKNDKRLIVAGSTWAGDEEIFFPAIKELMKTDIRLIIAPHETDENRIQDLLKRASKYFSQSEIMRYSSPEIPDHKQLLIIDTIGILSSVYNYCDIAWIGGGFDNGIHNILEAAAFGKPVVFGPNYEKFKEATELISAGGAFSISNKDEAAFVLNSLTSDDIKYKESCKASLEYVNSQTGATDKITSFLRENN